MLGADDAAAVDDEAFGDARRAERDLDLAAVVAADAVERVAVLGEEGGDVLGPVADGDGVDLHARGA